MKKIIYLLVLCSSCNLFKYVFYPKHILGNWRSIKYNVAYPMLTFKKDSIAVLHSRADTVHIYKYFIKTKHICFSHNKICEKQITILKLTQDSLIIKGLPYINGS